MEVAQKGIQQVPFLLLLLLLTGSGCHSRWSPHTAPVPLHSLSISSAELLDIAVDRGDDEDSGQREPASFSYNVRVSAREQVGPIVFVPGVGGSQLEAKLNKTSRVHRLCQLKSDWYNLWLNIHLLSPLAFDCLCDNMRLTYDVQAGMTSDSPGVQVRAKNFASLESVANLDKYRLPKTDYFEKIIAHLENKYSLERDSDMLGAPYDFRKAPNDGLDLFFHNLTALIEDAYISHNNSSVTLICHSMGCLNSQVLLNNKTQVWRDTHIKRLVSLAAPWDGSIAAISAMLIGDNMGVPVMSSMRSKLRTLQATFSSLYYLFPKEPTFTAEQTFVTTPSANYSLKNIDALFASVMLSDQAHMWHNMQSLVAGLGAPHVELWCLYGSGHQTPLRIDYIGNVMESDYQVVYGNGDGTVNEASLTACKSFATKQTQPVHTIKFDGIDHIGLLRSDQVADYVANTIITI